MRILRMVILTAVVVLNAGCGSRSGPGPTESMPDKTDLAKRVQGTYRVIAARFRDEEKNDLANFTITFDGNRMIARDLRSPEPKAEQFRVDESTTPVHIDVWPDGADPAQGVNMGLIRIDGEFLELCMTPGRPVRVQEVKKEDGQVVPMVERPNGKLVPFDRKAFMMRPAGLSPEFGMHIVMKRVRN